MEGPHAEGGGHGLVIHGGLGVSGGQVGPGVVAALVVVVLHVEAGELGEADAQRAAGVVDVLPVQGLREREKTWGLEGAARLTESQRPGGRRRKEETSYQFRVLGGHPVGVLQQGLELAVLGEGDDLQHHTELGEDLQSGEREREVRW